MTCKCGSDRIVQVSAKCSDMVNASQSGYKDLEGTVPPGVGSGDYIRFSYCLSCGQIQKWVPQPNIVEDEEDE